MQSSDFKFAAPNDLVIIERFLSWIAWAEKCTVHHQEGTNRLWLIANNLFVLVPVDCENYPDNLDEVFLASSTTGLRPGAIFYGNPTDYRRDEINYTALQRELVVHWIGAENQVAYILWLRKLSDGFDLMSLLFYNKNE